MSISRRDRRGFSQRIIGAAILLALAVPVQAQTKLYVDGDDGSATGDGISWGTAFKYLQDAIAAASVPGGPFQIWVAATDPGNPYQPDQSAANPDGTRDRHATFALQSGVELYGGFLGLDHPTLPLGEEFLAQSNPEANPTVLTGTQPPTGPPPECGDPSAGSCFAANGTPGCDEPFCCSAVCDTPNFAFCCDIAWIQTCADLAVVTCPTEAYHVVTGINPANTVRLEGFTITGGVADGLGDDDMRGGGIFLKSGSISSTDERPVIVRCTVKGNSAVEGGGMYAMDDPTSSGLFPEVIDCRFIDNEAQHDGGAVHIGVKAGGTFVNCLFASNKAGNHGGAVYMLGNKLQELINCTISDNVADADSSSAGDAGGVFIDQSNPAIVRIDNCILWANTDSGPQDETAQLTVFGTGGSVTVGHSDFDGTALPSGVLDGDGNIFEDPEFFDPPEGDYRLRKLCSPCIDTGNNTPVPDDTHDVDHDGLDDEEKTPDLDILDRVLNGLNVGNPVVDMGAYEFVPPACPLPWDCEPVPDENVGINDFLALLAQWGQECTSCDFGLTAGGVGVNDILALLAHWGPCPPGTAESLPQSVQDCINRFGLEDPLVLQHCICAVNRCEEGCPPDPTCP